MQPSGSVKPQWAGLSCMTLPLAPPSSCCSYHRNFHWGWMPKNSCPGCISPTHSAVHVSYVHRSINQLESLRVTHTHAMYTHIRTTASFVTDIATLSVELHQSNMLPCSVPRSALGWHASEGTVLRALKQNNIPMCTKSLANTKLQACTTVCIASKSTFDFNAMCQNASQLEPS